jgi:hypothetical protein
MEKLYSLFFVLSISLAGNLTGYFFSVVMETNCLKNINTLFFIYFYRKLKSNTHPAKKPGVNSSAPEGLPIPV